MTLVLAACTNGDQPENTQTPEQSYEDAKAQVPIEGDGHRPLIWRMDPIPDPDAAEAAEAAQHYFIVFSVLGYAQRPVDDSYFELLSHFTTDEWFREIRRWFPTADWSPSQPHVDFTGPRWVWIMDISELPDDDLMVSFCIDIGWYAPNRDGRFKKVEDAIHPGWTIMSYQLRKVADAEVPRWKVHANASIYFELPDDHVVRLEDSCSEWADHEWTPGVVLAGHSAD